jgi:hypothetical protein
MPRDLATKDERPAKVIELTLSPAFKLVFISVLSLTILSMLVACPIAILRPAPENLQLNIVFETCITTFKLGFGAIIGLLGGKAL